MPTRRNYERICSTHYYTQRRKDAEFYEHNKQQIQLHIFQKDLIVQTPTIFNTKCHTYTGLFKMIVGDLTTCHTQYT
jgi:hypothetical protein